MALYGSTSVHGVRFSLLVIIVELAGTLWGGCHGCQEAAREINRRRTGTARQDTLVRVLYFRTSVLPYFRTSMAVLVIGWIRQLQHSESQLIIDALGLSRKH